MPNLSESLQGKDLGHLRIIAGLWGIELQAPDARTALKFLTPTMLEPSLAEEIIADLPGEVRAVLDHLVASQGRMTWALFTRRYGPWREMGPGKRDREQPYKNPISAAEMLWYRGLVARAFFDTPTGPEEFAYIPEDLLALLPPPTVKVVPCGRAALAEERAHTLPANDRILDHACTLLASLRSGEEFFEGWETSSVLTPYPLSAAPLKSLLACAGLLDEVGVPQPEPTRAFLEASRGEALALLVRAWLNSVSFNELRLMPGLRAEGNWQNDPRRAHQAVLGFMSTLPPGSWWSLPAFISAIHEQAPDFQRPSGDYDSWFIRDEQSGEYLRGFEHWGQVDGALVRYLISGPMHWLGLTDLAAPTPESALAAFRSSAWAQVLLRGAAPRDLPVEDAKLLVRSDARLLAPRLTPRAVRYQLARFCELQQESPEGYQYRLTPASLERARTQGLNTQHLLALLHRHAEAIPPSLVKAFERYEQYGSQARIEKLVVLRLASPEMLQSLRASRAGRFLGEPLGPSAVVIKAGAAEKVLAALAEMGYLGNARLEKDEPPGSN